MRIRTIKPEFFTHEALYELERETGLPMRVAFVGLWCAADREGRFRWQPRRLGVGILPYDLIDFSRVLDALTTRGFIRQYRVNDECFGMIPGFAKHQVVNNREKPSELPEPPEIEERDASGTRGARDGHAGKAEGKGREGNMEGKGRELDSQSNRVREEGKLPTLSPDIETRKTWTKSEVLNVCNARGIPAEVGEAFFLDREAAGWLDRHHRPIANMEASLQAFWQHWRSNEHERKAKGGKPDSAAKQGPKTYDENSW